jgi:hypothetical protein
VARIRVPWVAVAAALLAVAAGAQYLLGRAGGRDESSQRSAAEAPAGTSAGPRALIAGGGARAGGPASTPSATGVLPRPYDASPFPDPGRAQIEVSPETGLSTAVRFDAESTVQDSTPESALPPDLRERDVAYVAQGGPLVLQRAPPDATVAAADDAGFAAPRGSGPAAVSGDSGAVSLPSIPGDPPAVERLPEVGSAGAGIAPPRRVDLETLDAPPVIVPAGRSQKNHPDG